MWITEVDAILLDLMIESKQNMYQYKRHTLRKYENVSLWPGLMALTIVGCGSVLDSILLSLFVSSTFITMSPLCSAADNRSPHVIVRNSPKITIGKVYCVFTSEQVQQLKVYRWFEVIHVSKVSSEYLHSNMLMLIWYQVVLVGGHLQGK